MKKPYYITTPIYYVNSVPHVGHALTMLVCDLEKRFRKLRGEEAVFLTGTDENGLKVMEAAAAAGETPQAFVDRISQTFSDVANLMEFDYDIFFRTTSPEHRAACQALFALLQEKGHIYADKYEGWYDVSSETFVRESDLVDGKSPDGNEVRWVSEENYFFRLSAFSDQLLAKIAAEPTWLSPESRKNEVVSFIKQGLRDICITRNNPGWGIPVPGDDSKVIYVWFDALINYLAATKWPTPGFENLWPADVHWMAKEIFTRFHATLWPAMLMAADLPLPKAVIAHGWFTFNDSKMSKSKGNVLAPLQIIEFFEKAGCSRPIAIDALRYCLARSVPYENDTNFTMAEIQRLYSSELVNEIGNALNRVVSMTHKFVGGKVPAAATPSAVVTKACSDAKQEYETAMLSHRIDRAAAAALGIVRFLHKNIDDTKPWSLGADAPEQQEIFIGYLLCLRTLEGLLIPIAPHVAEEIARQLGHPPLKDGDWPTIATLSSLIREQSVLAPTPTFPRLDPKMIEETAPSTAPAAPEAPKKKEKTKFEPPAEIGIEDFMKVSLKVARVLEAEAVEGSEKLVKLQVMVGEEKRQILAGVRKSYNPLDLVGRQVIIAANLKPAKLMGHESQGMILAADGPDGTAILLTPEAEAPEGASVH